MIGAPVSGQQQLLPPLPDAPLQFIVIVLRATGADAPEL
jgi:hypothetical protein